MIVLPSTRSRVEPTLFAWRAVDCVDESGFFARSYGKRVAGVLSRPSRKRIVDQNGRQFVSPVGGVPIGRSGGQVAALFEGGSENLCIRSEEIDNASWLKSSVTVTVNAIVAPDGALTADLLSATGSSASDNTSILTAFTADGEKCVALYLKAGTSPRTGVGIYDQTALVMRHLIRVTWTAGVPSLVTDSGTGTLYPVEALANGWYRILFSATGIVAANTNRLYIYPDRLATNLTVYAWGAQAENAVAPSSRISTTTATVTRAADSLYFDVPGLNPPRAMTVYVRGVENDKLGKGSITRLFEIASAGGGAARFLVYRPTAGAGYRVLHNPSGNSEASPTIGSAVVRGDTVEVRATVTSTGAAALGCTVNGSVEEIASPGVAAAFAPSWSGARLYLNQTGLGTLHGLFAYSHIVIAEGERTLAEMRELAGVG